MTKNITISGYIFKQNQITYKDILLIHIMEKRELRFYRDNLNYLNVECLIDNNEMYFDIDHLNSFILFQC